MIDPDEEARAAQWRADHAAARVAAQVRRRALLAPPALLARIRDNFAPLTDEDAPRRVRLPLD